MLTAAGYCMANVTGSLTKVWPATNMIFNTVNICVCSSLLKYRLNSLYSKITKTIMPPCIKAPPRLGPAG